MVMLRLLGGGLLIASLVVILEDVWVGLRVKSGFTPTSLQDVWLVAHDQSMLFVRELVGRHGYQWTWDTFIQPILVVPVALVLAVAGIAAWVAANTGRSKHPRPDDHTESAGMLAVHADARSESSPGSELMTALASCRGAFVAIGLFSAVSNVLLLTGAFFMLEIYDRVLPSRSVPTLVALSILAMVLFCAQGGLDLIRVRLLSRTGTALDAALSDRVYDAIVRLPVRAGSGMDGLQPIRDLDTVRAFLSSMGPTALFDLPWIPFYLAIIFSFHTALGMTALAGAVILVCLTLITELLTRKPMKVVTEYGALRHRLAEASRRNAEVLVAMGMTHRVGTQWRHANKGYIAAHGHVSDIGGGLGTISKVLRLVLQSAVLGVGAYLVIQQEASAGIIIAGSILAARALAPVDLAIAHSRGFVAARQSWQRLTKLMVLLPSLQSPMALPAPTAALSVEGVSIVPPGEQRTVVQDVTFSLGAGQGLGIVGPSGSGKSCLARVIVGAWLPARGKVRLDGASLDQWPLDLLGGHVGYLPQDVELFAGTVAQNIARFQSDVDPETIFRAAKAADVHDLIVRLPEGYRTQIGEHGAALSAGQRQRIALARALYGEPFLVLLDEPDSNLDSEGISALDRAIRSIRTRRGVVIVVAHRPNVLANVDLLLALDKGRVLGVGPKETIIRKLGLVAPGREPLKVVPDPRQAND